MGITANQISGSNFAYQHHAFERFLDDMVELERTHIELWGVAPHCYIPELSFAEVRRIRHQLGQRDLRVACITPEQVAYPVNLASSSESIRRSSVTLFSRAAELCVELESPLLLITAGRGREDEPREAAWMRSISAIEEIASYAGSIGIDCVLEPLQRVESNLVNTASDLSKLLADIRADNVHITLDTVAMAVAGDTIEDYDRLFGTRIRHLHLVDGRPAGHLAWGDGDLPLTLYLRALSRIGYAGYMSFELFGGGSYALNPLAAHRQCFDAFNRALSSAAPTSTTSAG